MAARNEITGDELRSKVMTKEFEENFDRIFRNKKPKTEEEWDENRVDIVGQNGNTGDHYE